MVTGSLTKKKQEEDKAKAEVLSFSPFFFIKFNILFCPYNTLC